MPPAPPVSPSIPTTVSQGTAPGAGPVAGASLGFDFGQVMAKQMQRFQQHERQTIAADTLQRGTPKAVDTPSKENSQRADTSAQHASQQEARDAHQAADDDSASQKSQHARKRPAHTTTQEDGSAQSKPTALQHLTMTPASLQAAWLADTPSVTADPTDTPATAVAAGLQTIELSPQVRIITDPQQAPSPESLAEFAKSMGLDESAIQNLLGTAGTPASATEASATGAAASATPNTNNLGLPANPLQAALSQALNGAVATQTDTQGVATQLPPVTTATTNALPAAPVLPNAAASLLASTPAAGLTPTEMAAIQEVQITVMPAVALPVNPQAASNTSVISTVEVLSLMTGEAAEKNVSDLMTRFSQESGSDESAPDQGQSQDEPSLTNFGQVLANSAAKINNAGLTQATTATAANMSEVYEQLSDKMTTELAARMHKQLSDGEWKMKFGLRPANLGGVEISLEMKDGKLDAVFHADNPLTREMLQNSSQRLREALGNFGINAGQVQVGQGGGNAQQNPSRDSSKQSQVGDNSNLQVNGSEGVSNAQSIRNKADASLLDLYA
jgi:flagellar hook-length control protein FliK